MSRHVEAINALGADAIVMVGDLVDDQVEDIGSIVDPVSGFSAPDGQFFAYGECRTQPACQCILQTDGCGEIRNMLDLRHFQFIFHP